MKHANLTIDIHITRTDTAMFYNKFRLQRGRRVRGELADFSKHAARNNISRPREIHVTWAQTTETFDTQLHGD